MSGSDSPTPSYLLPNLKLSSSKKIFKSVFEDFYKPPEPPKEEEQPKIDPEPVVEEKHKKNATKADPKKQEVAASPGDKKNGADKNAKNAKVEEAPPPQSAVEPPPPLPPNEFDLAIEKVKSETAQKSAELASLKDYLNKRRAVEESVPMSPRRSVEKLSGFAQLQAPEGAPALLLHDLLDAKRIMTPEDNPELRKSFPQFAKEKSKRVEEIPTHLKTTNAQRSYVAARARDGKRKINDAPPAALVEILESPQGKSDPTALADKMMYTSRGVTRENDMSGTDDLGFKKNAGSRRTFTMEETRWTEEGSKVRSMEKRLNFLKSKRSATTTFEAQQTFNGPNDNSFLASPSVVLFTDYEIGRPYEQTVTITNVSSVARRMRVIPPSTPYFSIALMKTPVESGGLVAPGLSFQYSVRFIPDSLADFDDTLTVQTETGQFCVALQARRPPPILNVSPTLDCGYCVVDDRVCVTFPCLNTGGPGHFRFCNESSLSFSNIGTEMSFDSGYRSGPFTITPCEFLLNTDEFVDIIVEYSPTDLAVHEDSVLLACDNCTVKEFDLCGESVFPSFALAEIGGVQFEIGMPTSLVFEETSLQAVQVKQVSIKNCIGVPTPFHWEVYSDRPLASFSSPVATPAPTNFRQPSTAMNSSAPPSRNSNAKKHLTFSQNATPRDPSEPPVFEVHPVSGLLAPFEVKVFSIQFCPRRVAEFRSVIRMFMDCVPKPRTKDHPYFWPFKTYMIESEKNLEEVGMPYKFTPRGVSTDPLHFFPTPEEQQEMMELDEHQLQQLDDEYVASEASVPVCDVSLFGTSKEFEISMDPPALLFSSNLCVSQSYDRQVTLHNKSASVATYEFLPDETYLCVLNPKHIETRVDPFDDSDGDDESKSSTSMITSARRPSSMAAFKHGGEGEKKRNPLECPVHVQISSASGSIPPNSSVTLKFAVTLYSLGEFRANLRCMIAGNGAPMHYFLRANCEGPRLRIEEPAIDFGIVEVGSESSMPITLTNQSEIPLYWKFASSVSQSSEDSEEGPQFFFVPSSGMIQKKKNQLVTVFFKPTKHQKVKGVLECKVFNGKSQFISVRADAQLQKVHLSESIVRLSNIYVNVPFKYSIKMKNVSLLPAPYRWEVLRSPDYTVQISPYMGYVEACSEQPIEFSIVCHRVGETEIVPAVMVRGMDFPIGVCFKAQVSGMAVSLEVEPAPEHTEEEEDNHPEDDGEKWLHEEREEEERKLKEKREKEVAESAALIASLMPPQPPKAETPAPVEPASETQTVPTPEPVVPATSSSPPPAALSKKELEKLKAEEEKKKKEEEKKAKEDEKKKKAEEEKLRKEQEALAAKKEKEEKEKTEKVRLAKEAEDRKKESAAGAEKKSENPTLSSKNPKTEAKGGKSVASSPSPAQAQAPAEQGQTESQQTSPTPITPEPIQEVPIESEPPQLLTPRPLTAIEKKQKEELSEFVNHMLDEVISCAIGSQPPPPLTPSLDFGTVRLFERRTLSITVTNHSACQAKFALKLLKHGTNLLEIPLGSSSSSGFSSSSPIPVGGGDQLSGPSTTPASAAATATTNSPSPTKVTLIDTPGSSTGARSRTGGAPPLTSSTSRRSLSSTSKKQQKDETETARTSGTPSRRLLSDDHEKQKFASVAGQTLLNAKKEEQMRENFEQEVLKSRSGVAFALSRSQGVLEGWGKEKVSITVHSDFCGIFEDTLIIEIEGMPTAHVTIKARITGSPLTFLPSTLGLDVSTKPFPTLRWSVQAHAGDAAVKTLKIQNKSCRDLEVEWFVFMRTKGFKQKFFDCSIEDESQGVKFSLQPHVATQTDLPFYTSPDAVLIPSRATASLTISFQSQTAAIFDALLVPRIRIASLSSTVPLAPPIPVSGSAENAIGSRGSMIGARPLTSASGDRLSRSAAAAGSRLPDLPTGRERELINGYEDCIVPPQVRLKAEAAVPKLSTDSHKHLRFSCGSLAQIYSRGISFRNDTPIPLSFTLSTPDPPFSILSVTSHHRVGTNSALAPQSAGYLPSSTTSFGKPLTGVSGRLTTGGSMGLSPMLNFSPSNNNYALPPISALNLLPPLSASSGPLSSGRGLLVTEGSPGTMATGGGGGSVVTALPGTGIYMVQPGDSIAVVVSFNPNNVYQFLVFPRVEPKSEVVPEKGDGQPEEPDSENPESLSSAVSSGLEEALESEPKRAPVLPDVELANARQYWAFHSRLRINFANGSLQDFPLKAYVYKPKLKVAPQSLDFGPSARPHTLTLTLTNESQAEARWLLFHEPFGADPNAPRVPLSSSRPSSATRTSPTIAQPIALSPVPPESPPIQRPDGALDDSSVFEFDSYDGVIAPAARAEASGKAVNEGEDEGKKTSRNGSATSRSQAPTANYTTIKVTFTPTQKKIYLSQFRIRVDKYMPASQVQITAAGFAASMAQSQGRPISARIADRLRSEDGSQDIIITLQGVGSFDESLN